MVTPEVAIPELDLAWIQRYCDGRVPRHLRDKVRIELEVRGRSVRILECRPPWTSPAGAEWTRLPVARLRHEAARGVWTLDWCDRNHRWHRYDRIDPSQQVDPLIAEIEADPTAIFWG